MRSAYKDVPYDPAPYDAMAQRQQRGTDILLELVRLILTDRARPKFMASRLNRAGITAPHGGEWKWVDIADTVDREVDAQATRGVFLRPVNGSRWL